MTTQGMAYHRAPAATSGHYSSSLSSALVSCAIAGNGGPIPTLSMSFGVIGSSEVCCLMC